MFTKKFKCCLIAFDLFYIKIDLIAEYWHNRLFYLGVATQIMAILPNLSQRYLNNLKVYPRVFEYYQITSAKLKYFLKIRQEFWVWSLNKNYRIKPYKRKLKSQDFNLFLLNFRKTKKFHFHIMKVKIKNI